MDVTSNVSMGTFITLSQIRVNYTFAFMFYWFCIRQSTAVYRTYKEGGGWGGGGGGGGGGGEGGPIQHSPLVPR